MSSFRKSGQESWQYRVCLLVRYCWKVIFLQFYGPLTKLSLISIDFGLGDVCLPGVAFRRFGPDDPVVFNIVLCRVLLHPFKGLFPGFNGCFAVFVAPDGITFFGIWFAFWDAIICYVDDNIRKLLDVRMLHSQRYGASK